MNNPMIILIGLAIAAVGTLVAVNVVLPMLSRAEAQALSSEVNTLAGAVWEAKRQNVADTHIADNIKHLLSGWTCDRGEPGSGAGDCAAGKSKFDNSQVDQGFELKDGAAENIVVTLKAGAGETCISTASFLRAMNSPFFQVLQGASGATEWDGTIANINTTALCDGDDPKIRIKMR